MVINTEVCEPSPCLLNRLLKGGCGKEKAPDLHVASHISIDEIAKLIQYFLGYQHHCLTAVFLDVRT